jgi:hypothetical protein
MTSYPGKHDRLWRPAAACTVAVRRSDCPNSRSITRRAARTRYFMVSAAFLAGWNEERFLSLLQGIAFVVLGLLVQLAAVLWSIVE